MRKFTRRLPWISQPAAILYRPGLMGICMCIRPFLTALVAIRSDGLGWVGDTEGKKKVVRVCSPMGRYLELSRLR